MSTAHLPENIPVRYGIVLAAVLLVSFVYAFLLADIVLWVWTVAGIISVSISLFVLYLFYRLVLAIERISYKL